MIDDWILGTGIVTCFFLCWFGAYLLSITDERARAAAMAARQAARRTTLGFAVPPALFDRRSPRWREFRTHLRRELRLAEQAEAEPVRVGRAPVEIMQPLPPLHLYRVVGVRSLAFTMLYGWRRADAVPWSADEPVAGTERRAVLRIRANEALMRGVPVRNATDGWIVGPTPLEFIDINWTLAEARARLSARP